MSEKVDRILKALEKDPRLLWEVSERISYLKVAGPWVRYDEGLVKNRDAEAQYVRFSPIRETTLGGKEQVFLASVTQWSNRYFCIVHPESGGDRQGLTVQDRDLAFEWVDKQLRKAGYLLA